MESKRDDKYYKMLVEALRLLAVDCAIQLDSLPAFIHKPDEIALIFDDTYKMATRKSVWKCINKNIGEILSKINTGLDLMSKNKNLWSIKSLKDAQEWTDIRSLARDALLKIDEENKKPNLFWIDYTKG